MQQRSEALRDRFRKCHRPDEKGQFGWRRLEVGHCCSTFLSSCGEKDLGGNTSLASLLRRVHQNMSEQMLGGDEIGQNSAEESTTLT